MNVDGVRVAITGGAGFLGGLLARRLLDTTAISVGGAEPRPISAIQLLDLVEPPHDLSAEARIGALTGPLEQTIPQLGDVDLLCHLAGVVSGAAERDFDLGMRTNLDALRQLLDHARSFAAPPVVVFTSSLAVFGSDPAIGPVGHVDDDTLPRPQSSYGIQKFIGEQLLADYTRRGFIRGRSIRLMTVAVRPGKPNAAASSFISGIIREPLAGQRATCPVPASTPIALSSPARTIDGIVKAITADDRTWGSRTALNLPALSTTPSDMLKALDRATKTNPSSLVDWVQDDAILAIVGSWPAKFSTPRANELGLAAPTSFDDVIREYLTSPFHEGGV